ncbi:putative inactive LRR receptor-like protein kinase, partial [Trifolium pratense]
DSSLCKADCETVNLPGCDGSVGGGSLGCCYPLSDHTIWHIGEGKRGVKLEFGIPRNLSKEICAKNADMVNATSIKGGVRCVCEDGYVGDGFANGTGCLFSCIKNGKEAYGSDCYIKRHDQRKMVIIAGILCPILIVASLVALFYLLKRKQKPGMFDSEQAYYHNISFRKACRTRLFSHHELEEATNGFEDSRKLMQCNNSTIFAGVIGDGSHVAIHKLSKCENDKDMMQVMSQIEVLSSIVHRNVASIIGCCIDSNYIPLVVYEYPANGTLEDHLHQNKGQKWQKNGFLDWYRRLNIATEIASTIALLHYDKSPPIFHHNLKSSCIFLDDDFSVKIAGFGILNYDHMNYENRERFRLCKNDVYDIGVLLLEIIYGSNQMDSPTLALKKIRDGKIEEIVDPVLNYHEQPRTCQEQILIFADLATRCLLFSGDGKMGMIDVARELVHLSKDSVDGGNVKGLVLEETFSNSSLLQMISLSPDSMNVP